MLKSCMTKYFVVLLIVTLIGGASIPVSMAEASSLGQTFFVAPDGNDENAGTMQSPFATLERARNAIRSLKADSELPAGGVTVYLREGEYSLEASFELNAIDSGEADKPIIYKAYNHEEVRIIGGTSLDASAFTPVTEESILNRLLEESRDKVVQIDLQQQGITEYGELVKYGHSMNFFPEGVPQYSAPELFFNGKEQTLARWPNTDFLSVKSVVDRGTTHTRYPPDENDEGPWVGFIIAYDGDRPSRWTEANDIWMYGYWEWDWSDQSLQVDWIDPENKQIKSVQPSAFGVRANQRYYVYNLLEEIEMPGEYYLDRDSGILYLYPPESLEGANIQLSTLASDLIHISNASHLRFEGMYVGTGRKNAFYIEDSADIVIDNMTLAQLGNKAVVTNNSSSVQIINNNIYSTGAGGITLDGGDRISLTPGGNVAENNHIHHYSRIVKTYSPAILINGVGNKASHNLIHEGPHNAIMFYGNDHVMEYNEIFNVVMESDDMGAIYAGRTWTERGNVIRHNLFHHIEGMGGSVGAFGVYLDDAFSSADVYGNVFYQVWRPVYIGGGRDNSVENNLVIDGVQSITIDDRAYSLPDWFASNMHPDGELFSSLREVPYQDEPWSSRYPELARILDDNPGIPAGNTVQKNAIVRSGAMNIANIVTEYGLVDHNVIVNDTQDLGFVDADNLNFKLHANSVIYDLIEGFEDIPFEQIGLYPNDKRTHMPAAGSFHLESPQTEAEVDPTETIFRWSPSEFASSYRFVLALDSAFTQIVHDEHVEATNVVIQDLSAETTYYWQVEAQVNSRVIQNTWNLGGINSFTTKAPGVNVSDLLNEIAIAQDVLDHAEAGEQPGQYPTVVFEAIKGDLSAAISKSQGIATSSEVNQEEVINALIELREAINRFISYSNVDTVDQVVFHEDFNRHNTGATLVGYPNGVNNLKGAAITAGIVEDPSAEDKSLRMNFQDTIAGGPYYQHQFASVSGRVIYEADLKFNEPLADQIYYLQLRYVDAEHNGVNFQPLNVSPNHAVFMSQDIEIMPIEHGWWYQVKIVIDTASEAYDVYIDGEKKTETPISLPYREMVDYSTGGFTETKVQLWGLGAEPASISLNNMYIYTQMITTGIAISEASTHKTVYEASEPLDVSGLALEVSWSNGSKSSVPVTESMVSGFSSEAPGERTLTVTYEGFTATYTVTVAERPSSPPPALTPVPVHYTISFDTAGGEALNSLRVAARSTVGTLPMPQREGYSFGGWYTEDGTLITASTRVTGNLGLIARWNEDADEPEAPEPPTVIFRDMPADSWAKESIDRLVSLGAIVGYPDGTFRPEGSVTRAEFLHILVQALGLQADGGGTFADTQGHWASEAIAIAKELGIVNGLGDGRFEPNREISRQEIAMMLARAGAPARGEASLSFTDGETISGWAIEAVETVVSAGFMQGYPDGRFRSERSATRAEAAAVIVRLLDYSVSS